MDEHAQLEKSMRELLAPHLYFSEFNDDARLAVSNAAWELLSKFGKSVPRILTSSERARLVASIVAVRERWATDRDKRWVVEVSNFGSVGWGTASDKDLVVEAFYRNAVIPIVAAHSDAGTEAMKELLEIFCRHDVQSLIGPADEDALVQLFDATETIEENIDFWTNTAPNHPRPYIRKLAAEYAPLARQFLRVCASLRPAIEEDAPAAPTP